MFNTCLQIANFKYDPDICLKAEQELLLKYIYEGHDTAAVLPTGFGKSLIFHLIPLLISAKTESASIAIVVAPITSLMEDQLKSLADKVVILRRSEDF